VDIQRVISVCDAKTKNRVRVNCELLGGVPYTFSISEIALIDLLDVLRVKSETRTEDI